MVRFYGSNKFQVHLLEPVDHLQTSMRISTSVGAPPVPFKLTAGSEIVDVVSVDGSMIEVVRGAEGTTPVAHLALTVLQNRWTAGTLKSIWDDISREGANSRDYTDVHSAAALTAANDYTDERFAEGFDELIVGSAMIETAAITTAKIEDAAITSAKINDAAITSAKIKFGEIDTAHIKLGAITTALIDVGAVGTVQIADGSITDAKIVGLTANKITAGRIDAGEIEVVNLKAANITVGQINGMQIADGAITELKLSSALRDILDDTQSDVGTALDDIADLQGNFVILSNRLGVAQTTADGKNTVYYSTEPPVADDLRLNDVWFDMENGYAINYFDGEEWVPAPFSTGAIDDLAITNAKIANGTIQDAKIATLDAGKITTGLLSADRIEALSIVAEKLAVDSVTSDKIMSSAVTSEKILAGAIEAVHLAAEAVQAGHIAAESISSDAILAGAILADHLATDSVTTDKIVAGAVTAAKIATNTITANQIAANAITADEINAAAITAEKIAANVIEMDHISLDGLHADVITAGTLNAARISVSSDSTFADGYDPSEKETPDGAQGKADAAEEAAKDYADENVTHRVEIFSTGGLVFKGGNVNTTLIARVYKGKEDVTDIIDANYFKWTRISDDEEGDAIWNDANYGGTKQITLTSADVSVRATFCCEIMKYN